MVARWLGRAARWKGFVVPPLLLLVVTMAIGWRVWTPLNDARKAFPWDAQWGYWGDLAFQIDALKRAELPLWNPYDRCGYPFAADPQTGVLYPVNWIVVLVGLFAGSKFWLITAKILFHVWWWALGVFVWLRRRGTPAAACYAAGVFCMLAFPANFWFSALNWSMAWAPWLLLTVDQWAQSPSRQSAARVALALAMCHLAGAPASFWYTFLVAAPYGVWAVWHHHPKDGGVDRISAIKSSAGWALLLLLMMSAGQNLATTELVPHTVRAERNLEFVTSGGLGTDDLVGLLVPRMPGHGLYVGVIFALAAAIAVTLQPTRRRYTLAGVALVGLLLALGANAPFLGAFATFVPVAGLFRIAHRYAYVMIIPIAALGAEGLAALASFSDPELRTRARRSLVAIGGAAAVVFGAGIVTSSAGPTREAYVWAFCSWIVSAWILRQVVALDGRWRERCLSLAAVILVADVWLTRAPSLEENWWPLPATPNDGDVLRLPDVPLDARIFDREHIKYRAGTRLHVRDLAGYEGDPLALRRYARALDLAYEQPAALAWFNVRYVAGTSGWRPLNLGPEFVPVSPGFVRVPASAPAVAWYPRARIVDGEAEAFAALRSMSASSGVAVLERRTITGDASAIGERRSDADASVVRGRFVEYGLRDLVAEVEAPAAGVVVLAEMFHPGWSAVVDGQPARIVPANGALRGLVVGPGEHRIEMRFTMGLAGWLMLLMPLGFAVAIRWSVGSPRSRA